MKIRHILALTLVLLTVFCLTLPALAVAPIEITGPSKAKSGPNDTKDSATAEPEVYVSTMVNCHGSITFWVYKNGDAQASSTYDFLSTGEKTVFYKLPESRWKVQGALYHPVWKTNSSVGSTETALVGYSFAA